MLTRLFTLLLLVLCCLTAQAALDIFMKVEGIPGESTDARHANEIVLTGYSFDFTQSATTVIGGGAGAGRLTVSPFTVTKFTDSSSPRLALASARGEHLRQVNIAVRRPGREPFEFLRFTLTDVVISTFSQANTSAAIPIETIGLTFGTIEMEYIPQRPDGAPGAPVRMKWDVQRNVPG